jgi:hypothetical protein
VPHSDPETSHWLRRVNQEKALKGLFMSNEGDGTDEAGEPTGDRPDSEDVTSRAEGRPPEEQSSDDPTAQAEAILQESEDRLAEGAEGSEPPESR